MSHREYLEVDPALLHLPGSRRNGADPLKLQRQFSRFGKSTAGMPPLEVSRGSDGALVINEWRYAGDANCPIRARSVGDGEVIDELPVPVTQLPTVGEKL